MTDLTRIPGIGGNMADHLIRAGYPTIASIKGQDPDEVYARGCAAREARAGRCALYCCRLAVYYAGRCGRLPEGKLNW